MIVATAGHIDHGKTALVRALTGVDSDRLPEEKSRGMSIDLGYAYHPLSDGSVLGFVDVPGHERFVRNMLAGVTGIDFALLIVAADDGPMPQTREHLAILDLLGLDKGAVALTKTDRVDADRVAAVEGEIAALLSRTTLAGAPIFPVSSITGDGVEALAQHLEETARAFRSHRGGGHFRLAIDRSFTIAGAGQVVTGTVFSGSVAINDRLVVSPLGIQVRVRGIHAQNRKADTGTVGQRLALNITGAELGRQHVSRGDWIVPDAIHAPTTRLDARLRVLPGEEAPLRHWTPVHVHLGAADVGGRVAILDARQIAPGETALVQLHLSHAIGALRGDRLILRDQSAQRTIAGGLALDPFPPRRGRSRPERLATLKAMEIDDPAESLSTMLALSPTGIDLKRFAAARNLTEAEAEAVWPEVEMAVLDQGGTPVGLARERWEALRKGILDGLAAAHDATPDQVGVAENVLRLALPNRVPAPLFTAIVAELAREGAVVTSGRLLRLPGHQAAMAPRDNQLWNKIKPLVGGKTLQPPSAHDMAREIGAPPQAVLQFLRRATGMGLVVRVADNRYLSPEAVIELAEIAEALSFETSDGRITARLFRDRAGIGRNLTIEVLEFFDAAGLTRRIGDTREVLKSPAEVFGKPAA